MTEADRLASLDPEEFRKVLIAALERLSRRRLGLFEHKDDRDMRAKAAPLPNR